MSISTERLKKHVANMKAGDITESTVLRLMSLLRELLEARNEKRKYPLLNMFCDWAVHTKLDHSSAGSQLLDILDETWAGSRKVDELIGRLVGDISPQKLREQIFALLCAEFVDPTIMDDAGLAERIIGGLLDDLCGKPVARRADGIKKTTAERLAKGCRFIADRLYFERDESGKRQLVLAAKQIEPPSGGEVRVKIPWPLGDESAL